LQFDVNSKFLKYCLVNYLNQVDSQCKVVLKTVIRMYITMYILF